jgi:hypothetical protein
VGVDVRARVPDLELFVFSKRLEKGDLLVIQRGVVKHEAKRAPALAHERRDLDTPMRAAIPRRWDHDGRPYGVSQRRSNGLQGALHLASRVKAVGAVSITGPE